MITKAINKLKSDNGSGLVLSLMVLLALSVLGSALGIVTVGSHKLSDINRDHTSAYYIAEAGANMAYEEIKNEVEALGNDPNKKGRVLISEVDKFIKDTKFQYDGENYFKQQSGETPEAIVRVVNENEMNVEDNLYSKEYIIQSIGNIAGRRRTVKKPFKITWEEKEAKSSGNPLDLPDKAVLIVNDQINYKGNSDKISIEGKVILNQSANNPDQDIIPNFTKDNLNWETYVKYASTIPTNAITLDEYEHKTSVSGNTGNINKIIIDTKGETINIISKTLKNSFEIINGGQVNLYVEGIQDTNNKYDLNVGENDNSNQLNIFYSGMNFELGQDATMNGMLFAPKANVELGNDAIVNGAIIANKVMFNNKSGVSYPAGYSFEYPTDDTDSREKTDRIELITTTPTVETNH